MSKDKIEKNTNSIQASDAEIITTIKEEHKYTLMLLSVLREQLADFDIGKTPDYNLMFDIMHYMSNFPQKFNNPVKNQLIQFIIDKDPENNSVLETILAEKRQIATRSKEVISALKSLLKEETILKEEQLKIFCKNYIELIESHIEIESQLLFTKARSTLTEQELKSFQAKPEAEDDQALSSLVEERYKKLSNVLNERWEDWENTANEFALAEFVGMGALFETIEPLSLGINEISKIVKEFSYNMYVENYNCYKNLLTKKQNASDYVEKPISCMHASYKEYVSSLDKITAIFMKTKKQMTEPYVTRKDLYKKDTKKQNAK